MKYLQEGAGEITKAEFEAILGPNIEVIQPTATEGYIATVEALEVTGYDTHTSCLVYLDVGPPSQLKVIRQNAGYLASSSSVSSSVTGVDVSSPGSAVSASWAKPGVAATDRSSQTSKACNHAFFFFIRIPAGKPTRSRP